MNMVPDLCEAYGDVRLLPGIDASEIRHLIEEQLEVLSIKNFQIDDLVSLPAVQTDPNADIVQALMSAIESVTHMKPRIEGAGPACDGWMFITRGIPTVCGYGAACGGVHGADEWIDLTSLRTITEVYEQTIIRYLA